MGKQTNKNSRDDEKHFRRKYMDPSRRFMEWVDSIGLEKTNVGKILTQVDRRWSLRRVFFLFLFTLILSFMLFYEFDFVYNVETGDVAHSDIKSPISFQIVDEVATEAKRREAEDNSPPVFDYDPDLYEGIFSRIGRAFYKMRVKVREADWPEKGRQREEAIKEFAQNKPEFEKELQTEVSARIFLWLAENKFSAQIENILRRAINSWSIDGIADGTESVLRDSDKQILINVVESESSFVETALPRERVKDIRLRSSFSLDGVKGVDGITRAEQSNMLRLAHSVLVPNLTFNKKETLARRQKARKSVLPVQISIKKNQTIVSAGAVIQPVHSTILSEIRSIREERRRNVMVFVTAVLLVVLVLVFFSYLRRFTTNKVRVELKDVVVMGVITTIVVLLTKLFLFMTDAAFLSKFGNNIPPSVFLYSAPVYAGPMMVGLLIASGEVVWLFTTFLAIALTFMVDMHFGFMLTSIVGGIAAARGVYSCEKRNDIYKAGIRTGLINGLVICCYMILTQMNSDLGFQLLWNVPAGFLGGVFSAMVAMMLIPLLESLFNYTTDVKLLELSSLTHPLMKEMVVKAPGTYHHSLSVGTMVEEAAREIEANPLLAKVMAYYHDIGKMEHPQYFIENQRPGYNPHDHITPYMSKTVLVAHVKDGAEMGLKHNLGTPIIDGILQHHGTTLISYFYNKAMEEADEDIENVEEADFRYPGPKPQFKEAALVMLADSIEAAARSLDEPTSARLTSIVENILHNKFVDNQLDQCNLTFKELSTIEKAFKRTLLSIYHHRIDYPHMKDGKPITPPQLAKKKKDAGHG